MNKKLKVALDVDGILANFYLSACKKFDKPYTKVFHFGTDWIKKIFSKIANDKDFWGNLEILNPPEAIDFDFDVYMTHLPEKMLGSRIEWLKKNGFPDKPVIVSGDKAKTCLEMGIDVLIDDKPSTIKECKEVGILAIQYVPYYSFMPIIEKEYAIKHLFQVNDILNSQ